jgi:hypothetical protein
VASCPLVAITSVSASGFDAHTCGLFTEEEGGMS